MLQNFSQSLDLPVGSYMFNWMENGIGKKK